MEISRLSVARMQRLVTATNEKKACEMGLWDKFKDLFRADSEKKVTLIKNLFNLIKNRDRPVERFIKLAALAKPEELHHFKIHICTKTVKQKGEREIIQTYDVQSETRVDLRIRNESLISPFIIEPRTYNYMYRHIIPILNRDGTKLIHSSSSSSTEEPSLFSTKRLWTVWGMDKESLEDELEIDSLEDLIESTDRLLISSRGESKNVK